MSYLANVSDLDGIQAAFAELGTTPATTGTVRLPNGQWVTARNSGNTADVNVIRVNPTTNLVELGTSVTVQQGVFTNVAIGTNPAQSGPVRIPFGEWIRARNETNTADLDLIRLGPGNQVEIGVGHVSVHGSFEDVEIGTNPALSGVLKIPNNQDIKARNAANTADVSMFKVDVNNRIEPGTSFSALTSTGLLTTSGLTVTGATSLQDTTALSVSLGTTPAQSGLLRIPNNQGFSARNAANSGDIQLIKLNASNLAELALLQELWVQGTANAGAVASGTNAAQSGAVRVPNGIWLRGRNAANTADVDLIRVNSSNVVELGPGASSSGVFPYVAVGTNPASAGVVRMQNNDWIRARNASNTADIDVVKVGTDNVVSFGGTPWASSIRLGTNSAASGALRLPNNQGIAARNAANSADLELVRLGSDNLLYLAEAQMPSLRLGSNTANSGALRLPNNVGISGRNVLNDADIEIIKLDAFNHVSLGQVHTLTVWGQATIGGTVDCAGWVYTGRLTAREDVELQNTTALTLAVGTSGQAKAQSGLIRMPNNQGISARNWQNSGDVELLKLNGSNLVQIGELESLNVYGSSDLDGTLDVHNWTFTDSLQVRGYSWLRGDVRALSVTVGREDQAPAAGGFIRLPNDESIFARNPQNTADIPIIKIDTTGRVRFGTDIDNIDVAYGGLFGSIDCSGLLTTSGLNVTGNGSIGNLSAGEVHASTLWAPADSYLAWVHADTYWADHDCNLVQGSYGSLGLFGMPTSTPNTGGGTIKMGNCFGAPSHTNISGGVLYVQNGELWFRGGWGTTTRIANA